MPPYNIRLNENLKRGRQKLYRYLDTDYTLPQYRMNGKERNIIQDVIRVLEGFEGEPFYDWARQMKRDGHMVYISECASSG